MFRHGRSKNYYKNEFNDRMLNSEKKVLYESVAIFFQRISHIILELQDEFAKKKKNIRKTFRK